MKYLLLIYGIVFQNINIYSQLSIGTSIGYSFQLMGQNLEEGNHVRNGNIDIISNSKSKLGAGLLTKIWMDYPLSDLLSIKVQLINLNNTASFVNNYIFESVQVSSYKSNITNLSLLIGFDNKYKSISYKFYFGGEFGFNNNLIKAEHFEDKQFNYISDYDIKYTDKFNLGIIAENQVLYYFKFKKEITFGLNLSINYSLFSPDKSEVISSIENGINILPMLTINEKEAIYKDNYIENIKKPIDPNLPKNTFKQYYYRSGISTSLVLGIKF